MFKVIKIIIFAIGVSFSPPNNDQTWGDMATLNNESTMVNEEINEMATTSTVDTKNTRGIIFAFNKFMKHKSVNAIVN